MTKKLVFPALLFALLFLMPIVACDEGVAQQAAEDASTIVDSASKAAESTVEIIEGNMPTPDKIEVTQGELDSCNALSKVAPISPNVWGSLCEQIAWAQANNVPVVIKGQ